MFRGLKVLAGDVAIQQWRHGVCERKNALLRRVGSLAGQQRSGEARQCAVAAVHLEGIGDQVKFGPVLAGDTAIVRPEPVKNKLAGVPFCDEIAVGGKGCVPRHGQYNGLVFDWRPAGSGQAVLRRVDGVAGSLATKKNDEKVGVRGLLLFLSLVLIEAQKEVPGPE